MRFRNIIFGSFLE